MIHVPYTNIRFTHQSGFYLLEGVHKDAYRFFCCRDMVAIFREKNYSPKHGTDRNFYSFRRNSIFFAEQKTLRISFRTIPRKMKISEFCSEVRNTRNVLSKSEPQSDRKNFVFLLLHMVAVLWNLIFSRNSVLFWTSEWAIPRKTEFRQRSNFFTTFRVYSTEFFRTDFDGNPYSYFIFSIYIYMYITCTFTPENIAKAVAELSGTRALLLYVWNMGNSKMKYAIQTQQNAFKLCRNFS